VARIEISGIGIEYELLGERGSPAIAITPGGRFAKDAPGLPELAQKLVAGGKRVLLWDRPNCRARWNWDRRRLPAAPPVRGRGCLQPCMIRKLSPT
jgi:hypothetical protein